MSVDRSVAVGVEIGSKKATVALINRQGRVLQQSNAKTLRGRPATATLEPYLREVDSMLTYAHHNDLKVCGLGISVPGVLDESMRRPLQVPILPSLNGFPLCDLLEARYQLPTRLNVDVDAAILGEYHFGAGRGFKRLLFLTINAVVGASLVVDGQVERSEPNYIGHICHIPVSSSGPRCSCGKRGCINTLISSEAIQKMVQRALRRGEETSLTQRLLNRECFSPQLLAEEAARGDSVALQVYSEIGRWLAAVIAKYISLFTPNALILSGGVLCAGELLLGRVRSTLTDTNIVDMVKVVPADLGNNAILVGTVIPHF